MKRITIKDIAKKVGVSPAVISVVLNNKKDKKIFVSEEKRKKILEIAKREKYFPNKYAKALATGKTYTIGIIVNYLDNYNSFLVSELQKNAIKKGYEIIPYVVEYRPKIVKEILRKINYGYADGVIIASSEYLKYIEDNLKILTITVPINDIPCVYFKKEIAGKLAAEHLINTGCKRLCVAGGYKGSPRFKGFIEYAEKFGLKVIEIIDDKVRGYFEDGFLIAKRILNSKELPDGIFAFNDTIAGILISEFNKKGIKIPDDVSIIGCDNTQLCYYTTPNLTSIDIRTKDTAKIAIDMMIKIIEDEKIEKKQILLNPRLVIRDSTR